ncbi:MerR family DNA-binding protein [Alloalcanivorax profundimaris]|uniref:MerR family transcriptional regulator n=1 Tax=Alloalcanivorax profundimaris TaxID=2735259 RepID=A0ABS0ATS7_9GAMM|nr:MerR family DNA-binding protein [Alloalcanivorax profundimaris]MAO59959.1 MerR family transcriptional regulator [Alcanivorax sp.]MBM1144746.1 MerR family DNA-binding protein [Alcanivorax sp. ZXX171]MCQ6263112.1 MerR family DNA-binding protein [Alcanivorax sp. MM125-6]MAY10931.1 MerR family transcriptional regulator [Alcanivorax sp.]MBF1801360.1 MerR family DNA-binding protein [Alloalcanivorax profundimaris]|tara:strand:+ start:15316 stop:15741 length:426 start_codon:yes stop_codon:yes gene_type:complete
MRVTDLAQRADTTAETVRHYTDLGLLRPRRDPGNGYRLYGGDDLRRLRFALKARSLGFTLSDVRELIEESEGGEAPCPRVRRLIEARLAQVEERIRELSGLSERMRAAMAAWEDAPDCRLDDGRVCGLIDSFNAAGEETHP